MAIRLRYDGGLSHAEIGEVMGISPMAATQLVLRGLEELKKLLGV
jgi:DNA-directed RNA polymerase specialized sigma subunit